MAWLILGLVLFLGIHSARIVAEDARTRFIAQRGAQTWKGLYTVVSLLGFALIIWGFGQARQTPVVLWATPTWTKHLAALLNVGAFILMLAAYIPRNGIKAKLHHPMVLSVKVWALAHLISNNTLADVALFGSFLLWAVLCFRASRARDRALELHYPAGTLSATLITAVAGTAVAGAFAMFAHAPLIGVRPF